MYFLLCTLSVLFLALCKGPPYRHENGSINWMQLKRYIGSKTMREVKIFAKKFHAMEHGITYPEFSTKAAIDVWRQLAEKTKAEGLIMILLVSSREYLKLLHHKQYINLVDHSELRNWTFFLMK